MRRAYHNVHLILDGDNFLGVSLGYDFTAEHEWGIDGIKRKFGLTNKKLGVSNRIITKGEVFFAEETELCVLTSKKPFNKEEPYTPKDLLAYDINYLGDNIETAWDESDFCIATKNIELYKYLDELYVNFNKKNIVITFLSTGLNPFENASLSILIKDKLPKEIIDEMYFFDKKEDDLIKYEKKIGVTKLKEKAKENSEYKGDKYFVACSPNWIDYENEENREKRKKELGTKYDITFWVNYSDDDDNYGHYIAEDIIKWLSTPGLKLTQIKHDD